MKYCTFWYPTIYHQELNQLSVSETSLEDDISDGGEIYHIKITLQTTGDIEVVSSLGSSVPYTVLLKKTADCKTGFVQYSFDTESVGNGYLDKFETVLCKDIYHLAKRFYHEHETQEGKDGALRAVLTDMPEALDVADNKFLVQFLATYHDIFQSYAKDLSYLNKVAQKREARVTLIQQKIKKLSTKARGEDVLKETEVRINKQQEKLNGHLLDINRLCESALIEYTYYRTLSNSKYNKSFHHNIVPQDDQQAVYREKAANIRNSIRYIENIKYINQNRFNRFSVYKLDEAKRLQEESKFLQEESKSLQVESKALQEKSKALQEETKDSIDQVHHTEKVNSVVAWFSVFLAITFGLSPIVGSVVNYFKKQIAIEWIELAFDVILIIGAVYYICRYYKISRKKGNS